LTLPRELVGNANENFVVKAQAVKQFNEIVNQSFQRFEIPQMEESVIEYAGMNQINTKFTAEG
jgi:hypothetical protein